MADRDSDNDPNKTGTGGAARDEDSSENKSYRDMLLDSLKSKAGGKNAANWVEKLANDTQQALGNQATLKLPGNVRDMYMQESVTTWVDKLFDIFLEYAYDFNPAVVGTNLEITWERPVLFNETVKESKWRDATTKTWHFKGTVSTRAWSLIVRGAKEKIHAYIVPNDMIIAMSSSTINFNTYLEMLGSFDRGTIRWTVDDVEMPFERVDAVAQDLFGALIRVARGEQKEDEKSHLHASAHKAPPPIPHQSLTGKYKVMPSASVDQTESMKLTFSADYVPNNKDLLRESGTFKLPKVKPAQPAPAEAKPAQSAPAEAKKSKVVEDTILEDVPLTEKYADAMAEIEKNKASAKAPTPAADKPMPAAKEPAQPASGSDESAKEKPSAQKKDETPAVSEPKASQETPKAATSAVEKGEVDLMVDGKEINVSQACDLLVGVIDRDLESLAKAGSDAFTNRDMKAAEDVLKKSASLNEFREQISSLLSQWKEKL